GYEMPSACVLEPTSSQSRRLVAEGTIPSGMNEWTLPHLSLVADEDSGGAEPSIEAAEPGSELPPGIECVWNTTARTATLQPTISPIEPGLYHFKLLRVTNPSEVRDVVPDADSDCGMSSCFKLESF
ncbi:hypothetical protein FOZ62_022660, partial [Perkinsus olseni]